MEGRAERAQAQGNRRPNRQVKGLVSSGLDGAGGSIGVSSCHLSAGKKGTGLPHLHRSCGSGHLVKLRPDPGRATKLAWHCVRTAAALPLGRSWAGGWTPHSL